MIDLNTKYLNKKIKLDNVYSKYKKNVEDYHEKINDRLIPGSNMLGWLDYPNNISKKLIDEIENFVKNFKKKNIKNILIISIGGSYTATRAAIDMCIPPFGRDINVYYANSLSSGYLTSLKNDLSKKDFAIIIISKSGGTLEPAISLRLFYEILLKKYGVEESKSRVIAITSEKDGKLIQIAKKYNWKTFYILDDIGGRFSALTPVSLVPLAILGLNIKNVIKGAKKAHKDCSNRNLKNNTAYQYAVLRHYLNTKLNKQIEVFGSYEEECFYFLEHLKQLFGESEGKDKKGIFPAISRYTTDLHSMGQYLQDGSKIFFETLLITKKINNDLKIKDFFNNYDELNYLLKTNISEINNLACKSTTEAHSLEGDINIIQIIVDELNEETFGYLYYWFSKVVTMSALLLGVNPFDQPGVENYKNRLKSYINKK